MSRPSGLRLIRIVVPGDRPRRWHVDLARRLAAASGARVEVERTGIRSWPQALDLLLVLEDAIGRVPRDGGAFAPADATAHDLAPGSNPPDLVVDLSGEAISPDAKGLRVLFDGVPGEAALLSILMEGRRPVVHVVDARSGRILAAGRPGTEEAGSLSVAAGDVLARSCALVVEALHAGEGGGPAAPEAGCAPLPSPSVRAAVRRLVRMLPFVVAHRLYRLCCYAPHWRVGWRFVTGEDVVDLRGLPASGWSVLPDDGARFYADPFPLVRGGERHVFVEDYDHRLGKGVISAVRFDDRGPIGVPEPVLERPYHLSYPLVFERDGEVFMIPETCTAGTVELYRAQRFPGGWVREAVLLEGVVASDVTPHFDGRTWWLFATVRDGAGSHSDALHLWMADDILGPWRAHPANPVLVDVSATRPAGRVVVREGRLIRPVQDCTDRYGGALALAEVSCLTPDRYEQAVIARIPPGGAWPGRRLHTLNRAGDLETIDGSAVAPRWAARRPRA